MSSPNIDRFLSRDARSAKRGIAIVSCLSVTLWYREHIGWTSSKLIKRVCSLGSTLRSSEPEHRQSSPRGTPLKFGWNGGRSSHETCNISETGQLRQDVAQYDSRF